MRVKGLDVLFDALSLIVERTDLIFSCWVVGGEGDDLLDLERHIETTPSLLGLMRAGRLLAWKRVDPDSLPEIFSRSSVTVMPSRYEPFGIVGLQAMSCGSPLVASAVGGLRNIAIHQYTGYAIAPDDPDGLAWVLCGILRSKRTQGEFSRHAQAWSEAFDMDKIASMFRSLYRDNSPLPVHPIEAPLAFLSAGLGKQHLFSATRDGAVRSQSLKRHCLEDIESADGRWILKTLRTGVAVDEMLFRLDGSLHLPTSAEQARRVRYHEHAPWAVPIKAWDEGSRTILFPFVPSATFTGLDLPKVAGLAKTIRDHEPPTEPVAAPVQTAWRNLRQNPSMEALSAFDRCAAALQTPIIGVSDAFHRIHPGTELLRLRLHATNKSWPLRPHLCDAIAQVCDRAFDLVSGDCPSPTLCHGNFASRHVLQGDQGLVLCDFEESRYAIGPFDEACWLTQEVAQVDPDCGADRVAEMLRLMIFDSQQRQCTAAWIVVGILYNGLWHAMQGQMTAPDASIASAVAFLDAYVTT